MKYLLLIPFYFMVSNNVFSINHLIIPESIGNDFDCEVTINLKKVCSI